MRLAGPEHLNGLSYDAIESIAASSLGIDAGGHRSEFVGLVRRARELSPAETPLPVQSHGTSQESFACVNACSELIGAGHFYGRWLIGG